MKNKKNRKFLQETDFRTVTIVFINEKKYPNENINFMYRKFMPKPNG